MNVEEYRCQECGHSFPSHTPIEAERCPRCGARKLDPTPWLLGTDEWEWLTSEDYRSRVELSV